jgi:hypothetical protein
LGTIAINLHGCRDFDFNGPSFTSLMFVAALIFLVMILIFMILVATAGNPFGCGLGYNFW